ncbi:DUF1769-domain-containing protein [Cylindrobasidium torrendii FP15055 ss-10]|uniref:DUF1769-domain-containing protein n=1 Tax=Cylindrobasidium torrendii FP15055 ss-10 TaxID=1314674 RepID=A0A0D7BVF8_9AGAR|nr:DUF1769-domain-containing protein [Cylindrobasidium torrendii FP15055 ss-10]
MPSLQVLAGPSLDKLEPISALVNANKPFEIHSDAFEGSIVVNIKGFAGDEDCEYFKRPERQGITWSIQVQGRFLKPYSANDVLFGNTFDRPLNLPWGSGAALKFMNYIDPTLEHDLTSSTKPWALSPLAATMPHFAHSRGEEAVFPPTRSISDDTTDLHQALTTPSPSSSSSSLDSTASTGSASSSKSRLSKLKPRSKKPRPDVSNLKTASQRRAFFSTEENRKAITFTPEDVITTDFCYGFLEFHPSLALRLPGGLSFDLMRYWDGQPVRFVCCERANGGGEPFGRILWCVCIEPEKEEEIQAAKAGPEEDSEDID